MSIAIKFYFTSSMLNMFRILIHPSSGACDFSIVLPHWTCVLVSMCVGVSVWLGWGGIRATGWSLLIHWFLLGRSWVWFPIHNKVIIRIIEANKCTVSQFYFDIQLYMFLTDLLSIIRSLDTALTAIGICQGPVFPTFLLYACYGLLANFFTWDFAKLVLKLQEFILNTLCKIPEIPCSRLQPIHTETPTHIETRTHDQCVYTIEKSQDPDDGCINVRNMLSIEEVK